MKKTQVRVDSRNRICLTKIQKDLPTSFYAYTADGKIILEPIVEVPESEAWLFAPENKKILEKVLRAINQEPTVKRGSFKQYLNEDDE